MSMKLYFQTDAMKSALGRYSKFIEKKEVDEEFPQQIRIHILNMISSFLKKDDYWDERTQSNIDFIGDDYRQNLLNCGDKQEDINLVFAISLRFVLECTLFSPVRTQDVFYKSLEDFAIYNIDRFDDYSKLQIRFSLTGMPLAIIRNFMSESAIETYRNFSEGLSAAKKQEDEWAKHLQEKIERVEELDKTLKRQESAFNFVGLYAGFAKLGRMKSKELYWSRIAMFVLGGVMPLPLVFEIIYGIGITEKSTYTEILIRILPIASITLILIYYFRVALGNYNSVRTQVMQIELRKSLCRFIQSYSEYSKDMRSNNTNPLAKFEDIIFSNIMTSEEKLPSTFDGIEQLAGMISAIKGK
ncbi:hypothetical protein U5O47_000234 [Cronobacter malonaticus]|nr:hypothetical protein [Cronobacter malonaticus]